MQGINGLPVSNHYSGLTTGHNLKLFAGAASTAQTFAVDSTPGSTTGDGPALSGRLNPLERPALTGPKPPVYKLSALVRDYHTTTNAEHADLTAQLKAAKETLKQAHLSGDKNAITAAETAVAGLEQQIGANRDRLSTLRDDVAAMRNLRQQLALDVKAGNQSAIQQDREAITQQGEQIRTDLQA